MKKRKPPLGLFDTIAMGQQIKALCKEKGLKSGDVSEAVGIGTVQSIYKWYREKSYRKLSTCTCYPGCWGRRLMSY